MQILIFDSIHHVLAAEELLKKNCIKLELQPVPRTLSSSCGMCIAIDEKDDMTAKEILSANKITIKKSLKVD